MQFSRAKITFHMVIPPVFKNKNTCRIHKFGNIQKSVEIFQQFLCTKITFCMFRILENVTILPVFKDKNTPAVFREDYSSMEDRDGESAGAALPDHIYLDAMGFGMGNCCLQMTFQACNICEARILYDQLATLCPILVSSYL